MNDRECLKRVAWISIPAFISTDRFIIPELSKYYNIDWYILSKDGEEIDFLDSIKTDSIKNEFKFEIINIKLRNSDPRIIIKYTAFLKKIKKKRYDMIYNVLIGIPYYMVLLRLLLGNKKVLVAIHNVHVPKGGTLYFPSKLYNHFTIKNFKYFQTFSRSQKEELLRLAPNKICGNVNFTLMDYGQPTAKKTGNEIVFLSFGFIREYKRIDVLIQAAQNAYKKTNKEFKVIIAGNCEDWNVYNRLIKYPELFDLRIRRIDDSEVPNLFAESDYFVAPYQDIAQSGSAIIALNYNLPIIASKLEAFEDYIENEKNGFLIKPADLEQLTEKIFYLVENHNVIYKELVKNIENEKVKKFSPRVVASLYMDNFSKIIGDR